MQVFYIIFSQIRLFFCAHCIPATARIVFFRDITLLFVHFSTISFFSGGDKRKKTGEKAPADQWLLRPVFLFF